MKSALWIFLGAAAGGAIVVLLSIFWFGDQLLLLIAENVLIPNKKTDLGARDVAVLQRMFESGTLTTLDGLMEQVISFYSTLITFLVSVIGVVGLVGFYVLNTNTQARADGVARNSAFEKVEAYFESDKFSERFRDVVGEKSEEFISGPDLFDLQTRFDKVLAQVEKLREEVSLSDKISFSKEPDSKDGPK